MSSWRAFSALFGLVSMALLTPEPRVPTERISRDVKMVHLWDVAKMHKQSGRESYSHRKYTKATMRELTL